MRILKDGEKGGTIPLHIPDVVTVMFSLVFV